MIVVDRCKSAFLKVYLRGQEEKMEYDKPDETLCGDKLPARLRSYGPRMLLVFSSGQTQEVGFKLNYRFETGEILSLFSITSKTPCV